MTEGISRQRRWQLNKIAKGLCEKCGSPRNLSTVRCDECLAKNRVHNQWRNRNKPYRPGGRGRPPLEMYRREGEADDE